MNRNKPPMISVLVGLVSSLWRRGWVMVASLSSWVQRRDWACGVILVAATLIAYGPAWSAGFVWDDDVHLTGNPLLTASDGLRRIWFSFDSPAQYSPLTFTSFYLERALWGMNPAGYHMVNILLHAVNALLVWRVLAWLRVPGAWLAAAVFALHPVQVESAAWISQRQNVLMGFFFLLTLLSWIKSIDEQCALPRRFYILALVCCALALSAQATACVLPVALLLILWLKKTPIDWRRLTQIAPFVAMSIGAGLLAVLWERHQQGAHGKLLAMGLVEHLLLACRALWFYAGKLLWPVDLAFIYPRWTISASTAAAYAWVAATVVLAVVIWLARQRTGREVEVAVAFFVVTLSPFLGFNKVYASAFSFVADHNQYLACIGLIALAAAALETGLGRVAWGKSLLRPALCAAILLTLGALTWWQCRMYADNESLWHETLARNPGSWLAQINLGKTLLDQGDADAAIVHFQKAIAIDPGLPKAHDNLGLALASKGEADAAIEEYQKALAINPDMAKANDVLGVALLRRGDVDQAIVHLQKAVAIEPRIAGAQSALGIAFAKKGQPTEAISHFQKAVEINPDDTEARSNLAMALAQSGSVKQAIAEFQRILATNPDQIEVCNSLAWLLATASDSSMRNGARALALARHVSELGGGGNPVTLHTLAAACAETGNFGEAISTARRALDLAVQQKNDLLAGKLRTEITLYEAGAPARTGITPRSPERLQ
jgi:protein O-mannosyl-transferase